MRNNIWNKRLPTLLGIGIIIIGIGVTSFLVRSGVIFESRATPSETPQEIRVTNITDTSFTISYATEANVVGSVSFGKDKNLSNIAIDDRDQKNTTVAPHKLHYITLRNLSPSTKYYFSITSGPTTFLDNGVPFETTTGPPIEEEPPLQQPIVGKVLPDSTAIDEVIVYLILQNAKSMVSTLVKPDGTYILPLNSMRTADLSSYFSIPEDATIKMLIIGPSKQSSILLSAKQISPVPAITLSQDYDFTISSSPLASSSASFSFPAFSTNPASSGAQLLSPKKNEEFVDQQPLFKGTASPGASVKIIIHSPEELEVQVTADEKGNWIYRPKSPLSPGDHNISITTKESSGLTKTINQSFTVYASGTQVGESATPSATPKLSISPTSMPTSIPTSSPTQTPTLIPSSPPSPTPISKGEIENVSPPGNQSLMVMGLLSLATTAAGIIFFLLTRRRILL